MTLFYNPTVELDGAAVRRIRETKRLTQLYVAKVVGVTTDTISRWENNRYPSIRRENLLGLADALEVDPECLIHREAVEAVTDMPPADDSNPVVSPKKRPFWPIPLLFLILFSGYYFWYEPVASAPSSITTQRVLPVYAAPGSVIPVRISLEVDDPTGGFIVREHFPPGWKLIESSPPASSLDNIEGMARWIIKAGDVPPVISYLIKVKDDAPRDGKGLFRGDVVFRQDKDKKPTVINGTAEILIEPFHWADVNGDSVIDDREVLDAFDDVESMKDVHLDWDELSALWDEGQYRWDPKRGKFTSTRSTTK